MKISLSLAPSPSAPSPSFHQINRKQIMSQETINNLLEQVNEIVLATINQEVLAGLAVGIIQGEKLIYSKGFGLADIEHQKPITPDTVFRIGSISKTFTAIAIMQLWEEGKLQLDDPVNEYLKAYKVQHRDRNAPPVTFRHLLTHTSGIGELRTFTDLLLPVWGLGGKPDKSIPTLKEYYSQGITPEVYPETKWAYANHAFATLGQLVEDISGEPFSEYAIRHIFTPLGMKHTDYLLSDACGKPHSVRLRVREELAQGYVFKQNKFQNINYLEILVTGAGSIFSSVNDMSKYMSALLGGGKNQFGSILKPETLQLMMEPQYQPDPHLSAMGLAFFLDNFDGHKIVSHDGGWPGFVSSMFVAPDDNLGVVVFTNTASLAPHNLTEILLQRLLEVPEAATQLPRPDIVPSPHLWPQLCGYYAPAKGWNTNFRIWLGCGGGVEIFVQDKRLQMRSLIGYLQTPVTLYPIDTANPLAFQALKDNSKLSVVFQRNPTGEIDTLYFSNWYGFFSLYKRPQYQSLAFWLKVTLGGLAAIILIFWREGGLLTLTLSLLVWQRLNNRK